MHKTSLKQSLMLNYKSIKNTLYKITLKFNGPLSIAANVTRVFVVFTLKYHWYELLRHLNFFRFFLNTLQIVLRAYIFLRNDT